MQWPGEKMTYVGQNEYQQSVYTLQISADCKGLIFTNGSGAQTVDITSGIKENGGYIFPEMLPVSIRLEHTPIKNKCF